MEPDTPWWRLPDDPLPDSWRDVVEVIRDHESGKQPVYAALYYFLQSVKHSRLTRAYYAANLLSLGALVVSAVAVFGLFALDEMPPKSGWALAVLANLNGIAVWLETYHRNQMRRWIDKYYDEVKREARHDDV